MKKKIAIQGIKASFHEQAALDFFGPDINTLACKNFAATCNAVYHGEADYATLAIENSIAGTILGNYTLLREMQLHIVGEVYVPIQLHLLGLENSSFSDIKEVWSHPIAIRQCQEFFEQHPHINVLEKSDTAACAKEIANSKNTSIAAIASTHAANTYGLKILETRIEKHKNNYTRFWVLAKDLKERGENNKSTITLRVKHQIGALAKVLQILADKEINLSKIQSLPIIEEPANYQFYLDLEWMDRKKYQEALLDLMPYVSSFSLLGEYQKNDRRLNKKELNTTFVSHEN